MPREDIKPISQPQETNTAVLTVAVWKHVNNGVEFLFPYHENPIFRGKIQAGKIYTDKAPNSVAPIGAIEEALNSLRLSETISRISLIEDSVACIYYAVEFKLSHDILSYIAIDKHY
tara:strand:- start:1385 stop:1735 length:351 start_codon:yes stop_codon:yes gene_type:complete